MDTIFLSRAAAALRRLARRLAADQRGNILIMAGFAVIPLVFAIGFGIDYSRAEKLQTKLNAAADAAALAAVDPSMITQSDDMARQAATAMFTAQTSGLSGLASISMTPNVVPTSDGSLGTLRTVTVSYTATSTNTFGSILHLATLPITGSSTASASQPPSINFYVAMDTSPSMLLPISSTGIANLTAGAYWGGESLYFGRTDGCDFACHSNNMQQWNAGVFVRDASSNSIYLNNATGSISFYRVSCGGNVYDNNSNLLGTVSSSGGAFSTSGSAAATSCTGTSPPANPINLKYLPTGKSNTASNYVTVSVNYPDTWWLAQNYATVNPGQSQVLLRTDAEGTAAQGVISYAYTIEQQYSKASVPPKYQMQFYTFNVGNPAALSTSPFGTMTDVATSQSSAFPNMGANAPLMFANTYWTSATQLTSNKDSDFTAMLSGMQSILPSSVGAGTPSSPQSVLMIITDGAEDNATDGLTSLDTSNIAQCNAIKKYTRIAILYTQYIPSTINYTANPSFNTFAANTTNGVPAIQAQLQACATQNPDGSYLMQTVTTDGDISAALNTLFAMSVQTARLVK